MEQIEVVVVGGSQAGLAASHELTRRDIDHLVLERAGIGNGWQQRWDSFCLVTPNWSVRLPGFPYDGDDPDGFMPRDEIVAYLRRYAAHFDAPIREQTPVVRIARTETGFSVETDDGPIRARSVVIATGAFQKPYRPPGADALPEDLYQIDLGSYTSPEALPAGRVLVVGSGQSGCQITEELHEAGREVVLACGRAPWSPRRINDRDLVWWALESGFLDAAVDTLPEEARLFANILATGHGGGHDLHLRTLQTLGVSLAGRFRGADGKHLLFDDDLAQSVAWGDEKYTQIRDFFRQFSRDRSIEPPVMPDPEPFQSITIDRIALDSIGSVLYTGGFRPDFGSWLPWPRAFDNDGFPLQRHGASTVIDGLYFVGLHFLRKRKSALLCGVGEDAAIVAGKISAKLK